MSLSLRLFFIVYQEDDAGRSYNTDKCTVPCVRHKINDKGSSTELTDLCRKIAVVLNLKKNKEVRQKRKKDNSTKQNKKH